MKTKLLLIMFYVLSTHNVVNAQNNRIGVIGGLNFANTVDDGEVQEFITEFGLGGFVEYSINDKVSITIEPMYLPKGSQYSTEFSDFTYKGEHKMKYFEILFPLKSYFGSRHSKPYLLAGPTLGFHLSSKVITSSGGASTEVDGKNLTKTIDVGFCLGGGFNFFIGNLSTFIEARYVLGLMDIQKSGEYTIMGYTNTEPEHEIKTRGIQIMTGFSFTL